MIKFFKKFLFWDYSDLNNKPQQKNEAQVNKVWAVSLVNASLLMFLAALFNVTGVSKSGSTAALYLCITGVEFLIPAVVVFIFRGRKAWLKYFLGLFSLLGIAYLVIMYNTTAIVALALPIVLACRYYDRKFLLLISGLSIAGLFLGYLLGPIYGSFELNFVYFSKMTTLHVTGYMFEAVQAAGYSYARILKESIPYTLLPAFVCISLVGLACVGNARKGQELFNEEFGMMKEKAALDSELCLAKEIQANFVPRVFPPFPQIHDFDIYGSMTPAKDVGGDLFDFFLLDDHRIGLVIADVSGKGVPASLFMVTAKTLIRDHAEMGLSPSQVFEKVNNKLAQDNQSSLFVTAWLGYFDFQTGSLTFVNAGHNSPLFALNGKPFSYDKSKHGLVLAAMPGMKYKENTIVLQPGDSLFLYTDGITEAINQEKKLYGEDRLQATINAKRDGTMRAMVGSVAFDVKNFSEGLDQFDDMTMLALKYTPERKEA